MKDPGKAALLMQHDSPMLTVTPNIHIHHQRHVHATPIQAHSLLVMLQDGNDTIESLGAHPIGTAHITAAVHAEVVAVGGLGAARACAAQVGDAGRAAVAQVTKFLRVLPLHLPVRQLAGASRGLRPIATEKT